MDKLSKVAVKPLDVTPRKREDAPAPRAGAVPFSERLDAQRLNAVRQVEEAKPASAQLGSSHDAPTEKMPVVEVAPVSSTAPISAAPRPDVVASVAEKVVPKEKPKAFTIAELNRGQVRLR